MRSLVAAWMLLTLAGGSPALSAESPASLTLDNVVRYTRELESHPLGADAPELRRQLLTWVEQTPDYAVVVCDILGPIPSGRPKYGNELLVQQVFGNVSYQIQHPDVKDIIRLQIAGVESVLKAYQAILDKDGSARISYLDGLLDHQNRGDLAESMAPTIRAKCKTERGGQ